MSVSTRHVASSPGASSVAVRMRRARDSSPCRTLAQACARLRSARASASCIFVVFFGCFRRRSGRVGWGGNVWDVWRGSGNVRGASPVREVLQFIGGCRQPWLHCHCTGLYGEPKKIHYCVLSLVPPGGLGQECLGGPARFWECLRVLHSMGGCRQPWPHWHRTSLYGDPWKFHFRGGFGCFRRRSGRVGWGGNVWDAWRGSRNVREASPVREILKFQGGAFSLG